MSTASRSSGFSPISASLRVSSRTLRPASIRMRVFDVARKAEFPALPLASTQNFTMTILPRFVLAGWETRHNGYGGKRVMAADERRSKQRIQAECECVLFGAQEAIGTGHPFW